MNRTIMLDEHLQVIHTLHELDLSGIKAKAKKLGAIASKGNILATKRELDGLKDVPMTQVTALTKKKLSAEYRTASKDVARKVKKAPKDFQDKLALIKASLMRIKTESKDPDVRQQAQSKLEKFDKILDKIQVVLRGGATIVVSTIFASVVAFLAVEVLSFIAPFATLAGIFIVIAYYLVYATKWFLNLFIESKKKGNREVEV